MNVFRTACLSLCLLQFAVLAVAQENAFLASEMAAKPSLAACETCAVSNGSDSWNCCFDSGWFVGFGGSFNSVRVDSTFSGVGVSNIFDDDTLVAIGTADGPAAPFRDTVTTFAPVAQFGYFENLQGSEWLWGTKFSYKYLGVTFSDNNVDAPQKGTYEEFNPPSTSSFTGNAFTDSAQTRVNHELALIPFLGRSFTNGRFYFGGGPVVFDTETRLYGLSSFADIAGVHTNIGGAPLNLSSSTWMWGGAWQTGVVYYLSPWCFVDLSYDFMVTGEYTRLYPKEVTTEQNGLTYETSITYKEVLRVWAQSFTVAFNMKF